MAGGREVRAGKAFVELALRDKLQAGLKAASKRLKAFGKTTAMMGGALTAVSGAVLGPLAAMVQQFSAAGDAVDKMAARTGLSAEAVSELGHAANLSGTDMQTLENGVRLMQRTIADAGTGMKSAKEGLAAFGLTAQDLAGMTPDQQLAKFADAMAAIQDPSQRTAAAMGVFGRSGTMLIPMLAGGSAALADMRAQAQRLGISMTSDMANDAAKLNDALGTLWTSIKGLSISIGSALAPIVTEMADRISGVVGAVVKFVRENKSLVVTIAGIAAAVGLAGGVLVGIGLAATVAGMALSGLAAIASAVGTVIGVIGTVLGAMVSPIGLVVVAIAAAAAAWLYFSGAGAKALTWLRARIATAMETIKKTFGGIGDALKAGDLKLAARILWTGLKVLFYQGVADLAGVWAKVSSAAAGVWERIRSAASRAADWVSGLWAKLPGWITGPLESIGAALGNLGSYLGSVFGDLFGDLGGIISTTFGGLWDAISSGDWEAAGQVIMAGLKAAWLTGVAALKQIWLDFKVAMIEAFSGVVISIHKMWTGMIEGLAGGLLDLAAQEGALGAAARKIVGVDMRAEDARAQRLEMQRRQTVRRTTEEALGGQRAKLAEATAAGDTAGIEQWTAAIAASERTLASLSGPLTSATDQAKQIVADATREAQDAVGEYWGGVASTARQDADAAIAAARQAAADARDRLEQTAGTPTEGGGLSLAEKLAQAKAELDAAIAEAKAKAGAVDIPKPETPPEVDPGAIAETGKLAVQGTFNAMAVRGLGADSLAERTARGIEKVADNTRKILGAVKDNGLEFA